MKLRLIAVAVAALALTAGHAVAQDTSSEKGKLSYALGYDLGRNSSESGEQIDVNTIIKGLQDGFAKKPPSVMPPPPSGLGRGGLQATKVSAARHSVRIGVM